MLAYAKWRTAAEPNKAIPLLSVLSCFDGKHNVRMAAPACMSRGSRPIRASETSNLPDLMDPMAPRAIASLLHGGPNRSSPPPSPPVGQRLN